MTEPERVNLISTLLNAACALNLRLDGQDITAAGLIEMAFVKVRDEGLRPERFVVLTLGKPASRP